LYFPYQGVTALCRDTGVGTVLVRTAQVKNGVRSPKFIWSPVYSCAHWPGPRNSPLPTHLGSYTRALLVSQDRRHLFLTPCAQPKKYACM
jgi:hypothetical protein